MSGPERESPGTLRRAWPGLAALVVANVVIAVQALHWGWGYYQLLLIYWFEAVVIGAGNVLRMIVVGLVGERPFGAWLGRHVHFSLGSRLLLSILGIGFFTVKFGGLALATGFWILMLPAHLDPGGAPADRVLEGLSQAVPGATTAVGAVVASHGISFVWNFLGRREFEARSLPGLLFWPYVRMALMLVAVVGGLFYAKLNPEAGASAVLVGSVIALKVVADAVTHLWEHRTALGAAGRAAGSRKENGPPRRAVFDRAG